MHGAIAALLLMAPADALECTGTTTAVLIAGEPSQQPFAATIAVDGDTLHMTRGPVDRFAATYTRDHDTERATPGAQVFKSGTGNAFVYRGTDRAEFYHLHVEGGGDIRTETTNATCTRGGKAVTFE